MHIVIDARLYGLAHAGIGRYIQNLVTQLSHLDKDNHYSLIVSPKTQLSKRPAQSTLVQSSVRHYSLAEQTGFLYQLNQLKGDVYHFPHFNVPVGFRRPFVVTIHDLLWHDRIGFQVTTLPVWKYFLKYLGYRWVIHQAISRAERIFVPANHIGSQIIQRFQVSSERVTTTYEAVNPVYQPPSATKQQLLQKYGLTTPYLIYTGSLYPHKNVISVVQALNFLPEVSLAIASARNVFTRRFMQQVAAYGVGDRVKLLGFVPDQDLVQLYAQAVALVQPSQSEGFGLTGLEAMASGTAVISSEHPVLQEIYGQGALFVNATQPAYLAHAYQVLKDDAQLRQSYIEAGLKQVQCYSWRRMAEETLSGYLSANRRVQDG